MNIDIKYYYLFFLVIIYFLYGLILSEAIDYVFPDYNSNVHDYRILIEIIGEIGVSYLIYFFLKNITEDFINSLFKQLSKKKPWYLNQLLLFAFSSGIFKHLQKSTIKIKYMRDKFIEV